MKERVLTLDLDGTVGRLSDEALVFFEDHVTEQHVKVIVPRGISERYIVELPYQDTREKDHIIDALLGAGFIQQETRIVSEV